MLQEKKQILYGICGIGNGHTFRQLPIVKHFADGGCQIVIFAYDSSYRFFKEFAHEYENISVVPIEVPYFKGTPKGLDFIASAEMETNQKNFMKTNCYAMARAEKILGIPDLVISDYDPVSAQYAYAYDAPLVTIDQQSKYLIGDFPQYLNGQGYIDEVRRLGMFFPYANKRIACSFFHVSPKTPGTNKNVIIVPPVIRKEIIQLKCDPQSDKQILLVYLTAQDGLGQGLGEIIRSVASVPQSGTEFHIFIPKNVSELPRSFKNLHFYYHGDIQFEQILSKSSGIVSTAGHTLLSEAMYLGKPVYAIPLDLYEQQMNADVIQKNHFGISYPKITKDKISEFIAGLKRFSENVKNDQAVLMRSAGQNKIIEELDSFFTK